MTELLHGKYKDELFVKFFEKYNLSFEEILIEARKIVSDMLLFKELMKRLKTSKYDYCLRLDDHHDFFRNLDERYGYYQNNLTNEDTIFRMLATREIIAKLIVKQNFDEIEEFNTFTTNWFGFDLFEKYGQFIGSAHGSEEFKKKMDEWKEI